VSTEKYHEKAPCIAILNKNCIFFFYIIGNRMVKQVLSFGGVLLAPVAKGRMWGKNERR
jgi:hypothetical protein